MLSFLLSLVGIFIGNSLCCFYPVSPPPNSPSQPAPGQDLSPAEYNPLPHPSTLAPTEINPSTTNDGKYCGHSKYWNTIGSARIVGGVNAQRNEFPWQVRLSIKASSSGSGISSIISAIFGLGSGDSSAQTYLCGATIINSWVRIYGSHYVQYLSTFFLYVSGC